MSKKPAWYRIRNDASVPRAATIDLFGEIGGFGITFERFNRDLQALGPLSEINLQINSPGGDVFDGMAIYNALQLSGATINVTILGLAASMASYIAMVGDVRRMPRNSTLMIHNPFGGIAGTPDEMRSFAAMLEAKREEIGTAYAQASGGKLSLEMALSMMDAQTWLSAQDALNYGLATEVLEPVKMAATFEKAKAVAHLKRKDDSEDIVTITTESAMPKNTEVENTTPETPAISQADIDAAVASARASMLEVQKQVNALCRLAGRPELAATYNEQGKSVVEVVAELDKLPKKSAGKTSAATSSDIELDARNGAPQQEGEKGVVIDSVQIYADWNSPGSITARNARR